MIFRITLINRSCPGNDGYPDRAYKKTVDDINRKMEEQQRAVDELLEKERFALPV